MQKSHPISKLPEDVLRHLFLVGAEADNASSSYLYSHTLPFPALVSHVSSYWRAIALDTARLWSTLYFNEETDLDRVRVWLTRTKGATLDIEIKLAHASLWEMISEAVGILLPHISRWRSFHADAYSSDYIRYLLAHCTRQAHDGPHSKKATSLESFVLRCRQRKGLEHGHSSFMSCFGGHTPRLKELHLTRVTIPWNQSMFANLTSLTLFSASADDPGPLPSRFAAILDACPDLHTLHLTNFNLLPLRTLNEQVFCQPLRHLRDLELRSSTPVGTGTSVLDLLHPECFRHLKTLCIIAHDGGFWFREHHSLTMQQALEVLTLAPIVESAEFSFIVPRDTISRKRSIVHLSQLRHLALRSESSTVDFGPFLDYIDVPALQDLNLIVLPPTIRIPQWPHLRGLLERSHSPLTSLRLHGIFEETDHLLACLQQVPHLKQLTLESSSVDDAVLHSLTPSTSASSSRPILCPNLRSLHLKTCEDVSGQQLRSFVRGRLHSQLKSLVVHQCQGVRMVDLEDLRKMATAGGIRALLTSWTGYHGYVQAGACGAPESDSILETSGKVSEQRSEATQWVGVASTSSFPSSV